MSERKDVVEVGSGVPTEVRESGADEVSGLVRLAIQEKVPVEVLERLVGLQERVTERAARDEFFEALAALQENLPEIRKSKTAEIATRSGGRYEYSFAPLDEIARTIRAPLKEHGFSYSWSTEQMEAGMLSVVCILRHVGGHEERSAFPVPVETKAAMSGAQKHGAALTYGKRQSLTAVLGLTTADDDPDGADVRGEGKGAVTEQEAADLMALCDEVGADRVRFLRWLEVERFEDIPSDAYRVAVFALEKKRAQSAEGGSGENS